MLRFLSDENFNGDVVRGLRLRRSGIDLIRVQDVGLGGTTDPEVLAWAAAQDRILLTHDRATLPRFAHERAATGAHMPGVFVVSNRMAIGDAIREVLLIDECSDQKEWAGLVVFLPW